MIILEVSICEAIQSRQIADNYLIVPYFLILLSNSLIFNKLDHFQSWFLTINHLAPICPFFIEIKLAPNKFKSFIGPNQCYKLKQNSMLLKIQDRQRQMFLSKNKHSNQGVVNCCQFFHSILDKSANNRQKNKAQQKISLKKVSLQSFTGVGSNKNQLLSSKITRNFNDNEPTHLRIETNLSLPQQKMITVNNQYLPTVPSQPSPWLPSCKSQQNLHSLTRIVPKSSHFKPVTFQFTNNPLHNEQFISTVQSVTHFEVASTRQVEKIDQTTCLEHQSQLSLSRNIARSLTSTKLLIPSEQKIPQSQEESPMQGQEEWSDESLSSQTNLRFEQIDQQQSISDSTSMHHKNIVIVNHGSHPQIFEEFRKAHTIRSNLSHDDDNFSGHSIVLDRDHPFVVTPLKKHQRSENRHYGSGDF